ncbi:MAG: ferritin-like domain-containing protein [Myxococcota bacterium]
MLLTPDELRFDFGGARFKLPEDRELLGWIFSQSLFGEATGCYCGAALYAAPDIEAATFLSKQAVEEFSHFRQFLRIFQLLRVQPQAPHPIMRFLTSHETLWDHHVALEMAVGEGLVLAVFYALIDTLDEPEIVRLLTTIARQEAGHVAFGETQTMKAIQGRPRLARQLLGLNVLSLEAARRLAGVVISRSGKADHPVVKQIPTFVTHAIQTTELRLQRMGLTDRPLSAYSRREKLALVLEGLAARQVRQFLEPEKPRIPSTYLQDPVLLEMMKGIA